jgi:hypothetical protein
VAKSKPGKFCFVQDFSFPCEAGVHPPLNSEINANNFTCEWGFFHNIISIILACPIGTQVATLDVDAAYRQMPVHPDNQVHMVVAWEGKVWLDHCVPFGATSSNGIFGHCGDAMAHLAEAMGMGPVQKWVNNFIFFRYPPAPSSTTPHYTLQDILDLANHLGWPWKESKTTPFAETFL